MRALLVAPDDRVREIVERAAGEGNWELVVAPALAPAGGQEPFDVVVVDCSGRDAFEALAAVGGAELCAGAYVLTLGGREGDELALIDAGADDILPGPIDADGVRLRLAYAARRRGRSGPTSAAAERAYAAIMASAPMAILFSDWRGRYVDINEAACAATGYAREELLEMSMSDLIEPRDLERTPIRYTELQKGGVVESERRIVRKDGSTIVVEIAAKLLPDGRLMSMGRDVSDRHAAAEALRASEERLRTVVEASPDMISIIEIDGRLRFANSAHLRLLGRNPYELIGRPATDIVHPDDRDMVRRGLRRLATGAVDTGHVIRFRHADGRWVPMDVSTRLLAEHDGAASGVVVVSRDVSGRAEAEAKLRESEQHYRRLVEDVLEGVYRVGADGRLLMANPALVRMLGYESEEELIAVGDVARLYTDPERRTSLMGSAERDGDLRSVELQLRRKDGAVITVLDSARAVYDERGALGYLEGMLVDITGRKLAEQQLAESEERYRRLVELSPDAIVAHRRGRVLYVNAAGLRLAGVERLEDVLGRGMVDFLHPDDRERVLAEIVARSPALVSARAVALDGSVADVELVSAPTVLDGLGATQTILRDVSARRRAEVALNESQRMLSTLMGNLPGMAYRCLNDEFWTIEFASAGCHELTGYAPAELVGNAIVSYEELIVPEDREMVRQGVEAALAERRAYVLSYRIHTRSGAEKWVWEQGEGVFSDAGDVVALEGFIADVTERMRAQEQVGESERRFRAMVELSPDMVTVHDGEKLLYMNQAGALMLGYERPEDVVGTVATDHIDRVSVPVFAERQRRLREGAASNPAQEMRFIRRDGARIIVEAASVATTFEGRPAVHVVARDVTDRRRADDALRESEQRFASAFHLSPLAMSITTLADGRFIDVNERMADLFGYEREALIGRSQGEIMAWEDPSRRAELIEALLRGDAVRDLEVRIRTRSGEARDTIVAVSLVELGGERCLLTVLHDVTDRKRAEEGRLELERKLLETQKLESLGVLAGGIAHDFNNLLVAIMGNASLAMSGTADEELKGYLAEIQVASQRAADLAKQMLAYSGKGRLVVEPVDLSALVEEMGHLLNVSIAKKASLELVLSETVPLVEADPTQLRQIVMNLVINAAEAIGDNEGVIRVSTGVVHATASYLRKAHLAQELQEGDYVFVEVADTGMGMDAATKERIFDPFFTTKFTGRGLGLAAVLGIVRGHKGAMTVESEPGKGTTFRLLLPLTRGTPIVSAPVAPAAPSWKAGGGTILVVDDEATVRTIASRMLGRLGFRVIEAADGEEGVALLQEHRDRVDVVLLDLMMPRLSGEEAFEQMLAVKPSLKVLVMSGYSEMEAEGRFRGGKHSGFIQKPFTFADLEAGVRAALAAG